MDIYERVSRYISEYGLINEGESVLAAVSGGADSMCMLSLLMRYTAENDCRLGVVTVDHGFRAEARAEAEYVESFCREADIPFFLKTMAPGECKPAEEAARIRRYELIESVADECGYDRIALAHNANDKAETMLFNLFRGSGISGLASIRPQRDRFIRPVMCLTRAEIEDYLSRNEINFHTDATNNEDIYSRNRIRHNILPEAVNINANAISHMNRTADLLGGIRDYILDEANKAYERILIPEGTSGGAQDEDGEDLICLSIEELNKTPDALRPEIIRIAITDRTPHLKDITSEHIETVLELVSQNNGNSIDLPYGIRVFREYDRLCIECGAQDRTFSPVNVDLGSLKPGEESIFRTDNGYAFSFTVLEITEDTDLEMLKTPNKYTKYFDYDKMNLLLTIRGAAPGDELVIDSKGHKKTLLRYMVDEKIPKRRRADIPVVTDGKAAVWVTGYRDSSAYRIDDGTKKILRISATGE